MESTVLIMAFETDDNKNRKVTIQNPKPTVTPTQVRTLADSMITGEAFTFRPTVYLGSILETRTRVEIPKNSV